MTLIFRKKRKIKQVPLLGDESFGLDSLFPAADENVHPQNGAASKRGKRSGSFGGNDDDTEHPRKKARTNTGASSSSSSAAANRAMGPGAMKVGAGRSKKKDAKSTRAV